MKLGPVTKLDKRNKATSKKIKITSCRQIVTPLRFFRQGHCYFLGADSVCTVCKVYIFINSNLLSYKN